jgi:hypothetical protein
MANLTFSKKGIPMGRNKSSNENNHSQWSQEEDNYIRMAAEENISVKSVAAKLGRTPASVYTRRWQLDIRNNKLVPRKKAHAYVAKKSTRQPKATNTYQAPQGIELFKLESGIPVPTKGGRNTEAREQLRNVLSRMQVGQSFVVPKNLVYVATYLANKEFMAYKLKTSATSADKRFYRIFRIA